MTERSAQNVANAIIGVAAAGAAYYVLRTPTLRRMAWGLALTALTGTLPAWFGQEIRRGWSESARRTA
jgi:hypothetical protein